MDSAKPKLAFQEYMRSVKAGKSSKQAKEYIDEITGSSLVK